VECARVYLHGGTVIVTCAAGLNRSGLVMGLTLLELGVDPSTAIDVIRRARPGALCNPHFAQFILNMRGRSLVRIPVQASP
jgi:protein-tyrosine phosphatase